MASDNWKGIDFHGKAQRLNKSVRKRYPDRHNIGKVSCGQLRQIFISAKGLCVSCGSPDAISFDHIVPLSAGGFNVRQNLQLMCVPCNQAKGAKHPERIGEKIAEQKRVLAQQKAQKQAKRRESKALRKPPQEIIANLVHVDYLP